MTEVRDAVVDEITHRSRNLLLTEFVELIERYHPDESRGIPRETIVAYENALSDTPDFTFDVAEVSESIDDALVDTRTWVGDDALYDVGDDRISIYPSAWHERLGGETDVREYVSYLGSDESGFADGDSQGGPGDGIDQQTLLDVVSVIGRTERDAVKAQIADRRAEGQLRESADQHPDARIELADRNA